MTEGSSQLTCPACGELVKPNWKICPACETRLQALACPQCNEQVKENWKHCPACEALLICPACHKRIPPAHQECPGCGKKAADQVLPSVFEDPVCGATLIWVAGGTFRMGDAFGQGSETETPVHKVTLDGFYLSRHPITQAQWVKLMSDNPSLFENPDHPVEQISWDDAREFARKLTQAHQEKYIFSLPTEAQWEYAARSGGRDELYAGANDIEMVAWFEDNSGGHPHPVGTKGSNGLGLFDMSGNVWEWCLDSYLADAYKKHGAKNPFITFSGPDRVIRGGSWNLDAWSARCARRFNFCADFLGPGLGFRLAMTPNPEKEPLEK